MPLKKPPSKTIQQVVAERIANLRKQIQSYDDTLPSDFKRVRVVGHHVPSYYVQPHYRVIRTYRKKT